MSDIGFGLRKSAHGVLTDDNLLLSSPSIPTSFAINCNSLPPAVAHYLQASVAENTKRAYQSDLEHFAQWGGTIPATPVQVASYLASHATTHKVATLRRRLAAIAKAHQDRQLPNPVPTPLVKSTLRGIRRTEGVPQIGAATLTLVHLACVVGAMGRSLRDDRDKALLLLGFAAGLRRSELVGLQMTDLSFTSSGLMLHIRRSKTDQNGEGRHSAVARHQTALCAVAALEAWLRNSAFNDGALFRPIDSLGRVANTGLSGGAVSLILKQRLAAAGLSDAGFSGHSLRAGFVTSSAMAGVPLWKIRQQTGHRSDDGVQRYIRAGTNHCDDG